MGGGPSTSIDHRRPMSSICRVGDLSPGNGERSTTSYCESSSKCRVSHAIRLAFQAILQDTSSISHQGKVPPPRAGCRIWETKSFSPKALEWEGAADACLGEMEKVTA